MFSYLQAVVIERVEEHSDAFPLVLTPIYVALNPAVVRVPQRLVRLYVHDGIRCPR